MALGLEWAWLGVWWKECSWIERSWAQNLLKTYEHVDDWAERAWEAQEVGSHWVTPFFLLVPPEGFSNTVISKGSRLNTLYLKVHITGHVIIWNLESHMGDSHLWWHQGFFSNTETTFSVETTTSAYLGSKGSFHKPPLEGMVGCLGTIWKHCIFHAEQSGSIVCHTQSLIKNKTRSTYLASLNTQLSRL